ncbi:MAG: glycerol acyltransferase, partial [Phycisphaerae bacterium]|nr:glycerol acyltransferase [Phycisphaerae bacterium]
PEYCRLFGPVSISNDYNALSRWLMVKFVTSTRLAPDLAALCTPRNPMRTRKRGRVIRQLDSIVIKDLDEVNDLITDIEQQHRTVPILLKQYLRLGARLLAFNIDPDFGDALDGLMYVDLRHTDPRILAKYLGREDHKQFLAHHGVQA